MADESKSTKNHHVIKRWVEQRGGWPATVQGTRRNAEPAGLLRIDFPGYSGKQKLKKISWEEFFRKFDQSNLAFLYQEKTRTGRTSRFNKFVGAASVSGGAASVSKKTKPMWELGQKKHPQKKKTKGKAAMNIFDIIVNDHENVKNIIQKLLTSTTRAGRTREQQFAKLREELTRHMFAEEQLFYPALMDHVDDREPVHEAIEEHRSAKIVLQDVEDTPVDDESWHPKLNVLHEQIDHHMQEEETDVFELAHEFLDEDMAQELGQKFQNMKKEARAQKLEMTSSRR